MVPKIHLSIFGHRVKRPRTSMTGQHSRCSPVCHHRCPRHLYRILVQMLRLPYLDSTQIRLPMMAQRQFLIPNSNNSIRPRRTLSSLRVYQVGSINNMLTAPLFSMLIKLMGCNSVQTTQAGTSRMSSKRISS